MDHARGTIRNGTTIRIHSIVLNLSTAAVSGITTDLKQFKNVMHFVFVTTELMLVNNQKKKDLVMGSTADISMTNHPANVSNSSTEDVKEITTTSPQQMLANKNAQLQVGRRVSSFWSCTE